MFSQELRLSGKTEKLLWIGGLFYSDDKVDTLVERGRRMLDERGGRSIAITGAREGLTITV